jgi:hypothetical protein
VSAYELHIERTEEGGLALTFRGPAELARGLGEAVARFEAGAASAETGEAGAGAEAMGGDPAARRRALAAARARRSRATKRHAESVTVSVTRHAESVTERDGKRDASRSALAPAPASRSGSPSVLPADSFSPDSESENARTGAERDASRVTERDGERDASRVTGPETGGDLTPAPWAPGVLETLRMTLGPPAAPVVLAEEWVGFVAHLGSLRASGSPRAVCEAEWMGWLRRTWSKARETAQRDAKARTSPRPGGRVIQAPLAEQADVFNFDDPALDEPRRLARAKREADADAAKAARETRRDP